MWILQRLKDILSKTLDNFLINTKGRWRFYILFYLIISVVILAFSAAVSYIFGQIGLYSIYGNDFYSGTMYLFSSSSKGMFLLSVMMLLSYRGRFPIGKNHRYELTDLFSSGSSSAWGFFIICSLIMTLFLAVIFSQNVYGSEMNNSPLGTVLDVFSYGSATERLISAYVSFLYDNLQIVMIVLFGIYSVKRKLDFKALGKKWKELVLLFLLLIALDVVYAELVGLINSLVVSVLKIPFEELWIPSFFGLIILVIMGGGYFMVMDNIVFYTLRGGDDKKDEEWSLNNDETDLLDQ